MKKILLSAFFLTTTALLHAQSKAGVTFNPQIGLTFSGLNNMDQNHESKIRMGTQFGLDMRFGDRFYFQPGLYYIQYKTLVVVNDTVKSESEIKREAIKLKALLAFNIVHMEGFKLRVNAGPSVDFTVKKDNNGFRHIPNEEITDNSFNLDLGLGADIWFLTVEAGFSNGFTRAIRNMRSNYNTMYVNVGIVF